MKKLLCVALALVCVATLQAQEEVKDVTKFLGIPIDGSKEEMIEKLKAKGFRNSSTTEMLIGEFNGTEVYIGIGTNNNKVYRIMVADKNNQSETDIKIRFNRLCQQFEDNPKYTSATGEDQSISNDEDISYEIAVHDKRYQAAFYQNPLTDSLSLVKNAEFVYEKIRSDLSYKYTQEQIDNPSDEIKSEISKLMTKYTVDILTKKLVWFMISESDGKYYISIFYDNEYNKANGEDL